MHIFKFIFLIFALLFSQNSEINIQTLDSTQIKLSLDSLLNTKNSISLEYRLKSYDILNHNSSYEIKDSGKVADSLILICDNYFNDRIVKQMLHPFQNILIGDQYFVSSENLLEKYYFINKTPSFQYRLFDKQSLAALLFLQPDFNSFLSGSFNFNKINNQVNIIGELDLVIENFSGNAEQIKFFWKKNKNTSQKIKLRTYFPHVLGSEIGAFLQYDFENYNAFYTKREKKIMLNTFLPILNNFKLGYLRGKVLSTSSGKKSGYKNGDFLAISLTSELDMRNDRLLPNLGKYYRFMVDGGIDEKSMYLKTNFEYQLFLHVLRNSYTKIQTVSHTVHYLDESVPKSRYFKLGGSSSLRGIDEESLLKSQFHIFTLEFIQNRRKTVQIKSFIDFGLDRLTNFKESLYGYGLGINNVNDKIIFSIDYSLSSRKWESGKIHLKWSARL